MISEHSEFARGGPMLRLALLHSRNTQLFSALLTTAKQRYASAIDRETNVWDSLTLQKPHAHWATAQSSCSDTKEMLWRHSNRVNDRFSDAFGSMYFVFYDGSFARPTAAFQDGFAYP